MEGTIEISGSVIGDRRQLEELAAPSPWKIYVEFDEKVVEVCTLVKSPECSQELYNAVVKELIALASDNF